jgi:hypothetical protein
MIGNKSFLYGFVATVLFTNLIASSAVFAQSGSTDEALAELLKELDASDTPTGAVEDHDAAEDILDDMESDKWKFAGEEMIETDEVETGHVIIKTTQVLFEDKAVEKYKIYYANTTLATQDFDKITDKVVEIEKTEGTTVFLKLDGLELGKTYYVVVAPVHPTDPTVEPLSIISNELTFTTKGGDDAVDASTKVFDGVSYTFKDSSVDLTWKPSAVAASVEVNLRHQSEGTYQKVGTAKMDAGKYTFTVSKSGNYFLKLRALNADGEAVGKEHIQTVKVDEVKAPATTVQTPPKVGPTTDLIIGLMIVATIVFLVYRVRRVEH